MDRGDAKQARLRAYIADVLDQALPGDGPMIVHRCQTSQLGSHVTDGSAPCWCRPHIIPADDPRCLEAIMCEITDDPLYRVH